MRIANNDAELEQLIMKDILSAVQETEKHAIADMHKGISDFYAGGYPTVYIRTYQLASTPRSTGVMLKSGKHAEFEVRLDDSGGYTTGKHPSMADVLVLTDKGSFPGLRPAVGSPGYWDAICSYIERDFNAVMGSHFS